MAGPISGRSRTPIYTGIAATEDFAAFAAFDGPLDRSITKLLSPISVLGGLVRTAHRAPQGTPDTEAFM